MTNATSLTFETDQRIAGRLADAAQARRLRAARPGTRRAFRDVVPAIAWPMSRKPPPAASARPVSAC